MKTRVWIVIALGGMIVAVLFLYPLYNQGASAPAGAAVPSGREPTLTSAAPSAPAGAAVPEQQLPPDEMVQEVKDLISQWSSTRLQGEGWLHVVEQHLGGLEDAGTLPNGDPIPRDYLNEAWYHLDGEGKVIEAVVLMKTLDGRMVQESVFDGRQWVNTTTGDVIARQPFVLNLDFGFSEELTSVPAEKSS